MDTRMNFLCLIFVPVLGGILGYEISNKNIFTRVPFNGKMLTVWKNDESFYVTPVAFLEKESIKLKHITESVNGNIMKLSFRILLSTKITRMTISNRLAQITGKCIHPQQIKMVKLTEMQVVLKSETGSGINVNKTWNITEISNPEHLILEVECQNKLICDLFKSFLEQDPKMVFNYAVNGTRTHYSQKIKVNEDHEYKAGLMNNNCNNSEVKYEHINYRVENLERKMKDIVEDVDELKKGFQVFASYINTKKKEFEPVPTIESYYENATDCSHMRKRLGSGEYEFPNWRLFCDMETNGGGWTVISRRQKTDIHFNMSWNEYREGFGDLNGDFWLGNEKMHLLTAIRPRKLRVDLWDKKSKYYYGEGDFFTVRSESKNYKMTFENFVGNLTTQHDFNYESGNQFSTYDRDNDKDSRISCARSYKGGWWFNRCHWLCLTCKYDLDTRFIKAEMKIR